MSQFSLLLHPALYSQDPWYCLLGRQWCSSGCFMMQPSLQDSVRWFKGTEILHHSSSLPPQMFFPQMPPKTKERNTCVCTHVYTSMCSTQRNSNEDGSFRDTARMVDNWYPLIIAAGKTLRKPVRKHSFKWLTWSADGNCTNWIHISQTQSCRGHWWVTERTPNSRSTSLMSCSTPGTFPCWPHRKWHAWWDSEEKAWQCLCTLTAKTDPKIKRWQFCLLWRWITSARSVSGNYFRNFIAHLRHVHTCRDLEVNERQIRKNSHKSMRADRPGYNRVTY